MIDRTACPICGYSRWRTLSRKGLDFKGERVRLCRRCSGVFLSPHMDAGETASYYRREFSRRFRGGERPDLQAMVCRNDVAGERFAWLQDRLDPCGTYLEIGCGAGNFLEKLAGAGYTAVGIEPAEGYATCGQERGLAIRVGTFPEVDGPFEEYDGILLFHVLEHIPEPMEFLEAAVRRLKPDGWLAVEVPDVLKVMEKKLRHRYFHRPHLLDFHRQTLEILLARIGLAVEAATYGQGKRAHHLLVVARRHPVQVVFPDAGQIQRWWRRLNNRILLSRALAPFARMAP